ncbi:GyrI-like domain-containing protein [Pseudomonas gingeri]|uniref:GyrI-like domain-containing protein n=1 Tax=Pseudomonas gingeri TaxID=117681 RepID=UPI0015A479CE|nr:GyrI-like domain-containing protein [Pseudomonas gingeri]NVZ99596.1 GyrI-like domain-containing protein [Pseudomonas gingeri]NWA15382.1 GyrI-like domain-containing protein [Pseudomonas gingeri]NWA56609.1 GyrI-like domain-containing protein [Pseudomonas gingeri]NWA95103.1 GyrI-like domain-containing protein [Pseudomonas gingeri]NWB05185.1 GyrI-like domain-containing protein [Pseudomonas gingeri]
MDVKRVEVAAFQVSGPQVRTRNEDERCAETARIGGLWGGFFAEGLAERIANRQPDSRVYGVYSGYESDASGYFDVTVAVAVTTPAPGYPTLEVQAGPYLVFEGRGAMPQTVIDTWGRIWSYFEQHPGQRRFATDFEVYTGPDSVAVYIGIVE